MKREPASITNFISSIILIIFGILLLNFSCKTMQSITADLKENCKTCSVFDKDCPYTDEELIAEEYNFSNPYCSDMGIYEMRFKVFGGGLMAIGLMMLIMGMILFWKFFNGFGLKSFTDDKKVKEGNTKPLPK